MCGELGLTQPSVVIGSTDLQTVQLYNLTNREGWALQQMNEWTAIQALNVLQTAAPVITTGHTVINTAVITAIPTTAGIVANSWVVSGNSIPVAARVVSVDSGTQITMDSDATATGTIAITFAKDTYNLPTDFDRYINGTSWDRTNRWQILGPDSPQIDEWHRSGIVTVGPRRHARQVGQTPTAYRLWPPPGATETSFETVLEYIQNTWVISSLGVGQSKFLADTDTSLIDPQAIILGVIWRFLRAKQFQYADQFKEHQDYVNSRISKDGGAQTLSMSPRPLGYLINPAQVPDGNWPGTGNP